MALGRLNARVSCKMHGVKDEKHVSVATGWREEFEMWKFVAMKRWRGVGGGAVVGTSRMAR